MLVPRLLDFGALPPVLFLSAPITAALFTIVLSVIVWRRRYLRGGVLFFWLIVWIAILATAEALELLSPSLLWRVRFVTLEQAAHSMVAVYWLIFVWEYVRGQHSMPRVLRGFLWSVALLNVVLVFTNPWHNLVWSAVYWPRETPFFSLKLRGGFWMPIQQMFVLLSGATGIAMLSRRMRTTSGILRKQIGVVLIGSLCLESGYLLEVGHFEPLGPVDPFPITIIFSSLMFTWGVLRRHLLTFTPVAREQVLDSIPAWVLVLDENGRILDANAPLERLLGMQNARIVGRPYQQALAAWSDVVARVREAESYPVDVHLALDGEERRFQVTVTPLDDGGYIVLGNDITREWRIRQELLQTHTRLRTLLDNSPDPMLIKDAAGRWELANPAMQALFDLQGKSWEGKTDIELAELVPAHRAALYTCVESDQRAWEHKGLHHSEEIIPSPNGEIRIFDVLKVPLFHPDGSRRELIIQARDITSQKQAEQRLRHNGVRQQLLLEISAEMNTLQHPDEVYAYLCRVSTELLAADGACAYICASDDGMLHRVAAYNVSWEAHTIAPGEGIVGKVFETQRPLLIENYPEWSERLPQYHDVPPPYHTAVGVPVLWQKETRAVLLVFAQGEERTFLSNDLNLLSFLAHLASGVLVNAHLREREREQRKFAETLRESALLLSSSLEPQEIYASLLDEVGKIVPYDSANLMLMDSQGNATVVSMKGYEQFLPPDTLQSLNQHTFAWDEFWNLRHIYENHVPVLFSDTRNAPHWIETKWGVHIRSWVGVPILIEDAPRAIFALDSTTPGFYTQKHIEILQIFAGQAALALQNALLFDKIRTMALIDSLTRLPNRRYLFTLGEREVKRVHRFGHSLAALMLDIDHFKRINDTYGHAIGDEVLARVAERLGRVVRNIDIVGRYGGEEFGVLLPEASLADALEVGERLRKAVGEQLIQTSGGGIAVTISVGVAEWRDDMDDLTELLDVADQGLYMAKQAGRNRVRSIQNANPSLMHF